jgi:hypothetical protein
MNKALPLVVDEVHPGVPVNAADVCPGIRTIEDQKLLGSK